LKIGGLKSFVKCKACSDARVACQFCQYASRSSV
jgi:hypothetical protein